MATVYSINRGINRSLEFKGIKAQYVIYLALGLVLLLLLFAAFHIAHINLYVSIAIILPAGGALVLTVKRLSDRYGEHGLTKHSAVRRLPTSVQSRSRKIFLQLKPSTSEKA
ncbi:DUF4133 domain-containing protein [Puia sp. P3]|uniref:DUF4133 domain-containing protein n=1 Tax=Puia sp. P3 TaxID=3423952 RepID=UPI003D666041